MSIIQGSHATLTVQWSAYPGGPADDAVTAVTITITPVAGGAAIVGPTSTGVSRVADGLDVYVWAVPADAEGTYLVVWTGTDASADTVQASEQVAVVSATEVTVSDVVEYIGFDAAARWTQDDGESYPQIEDALAAERRAQLRRCTYPAATDDDPTPDVSDLLEALKRRVQRNLSMRALPLAMQPQGDTGMVARPSGNDPEIRRLEAPYRRLAVG